MAGTVRSVRVKLDADVASYIAKMEAAGRATRQAFGGLNGAGSNNAFARGIQDADRQVQGLNRDLRSTEQQARRTSTETNKLGHGMGLLVTAATTLGPALIPIGAAGIPAVTGLAVGFGAAATAALTAKLAFTGVGDTMTAISNYQSNPTVKNLQAMREEFQKVGPATVQFVQYLNQLSPALDAVHKIAARNMFPGLEQGINEVISGLPAVEGVIRRVASEIGRLSADMGTHLTHDADIRAFFSYIDAEAVPTLDAFARSTGNFIAGIGNLIVAFAPASRSFTTSLEGMSEAFRRWSAGLSQTTGFQHFLSYIQQSGPQVAAFASAMSQALVAVVHAAAPWGSAVLPLLTEAARVFATIANSPIGPTLYSAAAAMLVLNRALSVGSGTGLKGMTGELSGLSASLRVLPGQVRTFASTYATTWLTAGARSEREIARLSAAQSQLGTTLGKFSGAAKAAAGVGGMVALADSMSRASGAMRDFESVAGGALTGFAVGGPWGAAIGAAGGALLSLTGGAHQASLSIGDLTASFNQQTGAITRNTSAMLAQSLANNGVFDAADKLGVSYDTVTRAVEGQKAAIDQVNAAAAAYQRNNPDFKQTTQAVLPLLSAIQGYGAEFSGQARHAKQTATAITGYGSSIRSAGAQSERAAAQEARLTAQMQAQRQAARQTAQSFLDLGKDLNNGKVSLSGWIREMQREADALRNFRLNAIDAAKKGLDNGLIKSLQKAGPEGALRMKQLANATQSEIGKADAAWEAGRRQMQAYVNFKVPPKKVDANTAPADAKLNSVRAQLTDIGHLNPTPTVTAVDHASSVIAGIRGQIDALTGKTVTITTIHRAINYSFNQKRAGQPGPPGSADGSTVPKDGAPYGDRYPYLLAPGEEVVSNRYGQADRWRPLLKAINAGRLADGGTANLGIRAVGGTGGVHLAMRGPDGTIIGGTIAQTIKELNKSLAAMQKRVDAASTALDNWRQKEADVASTVTQALTPDLYGQNATSSPFSSNVQPGSPAYARQQEALAGRRAGQLLAVIRQLRSRGITGDFLASILSSPDPLTTARMYTQLPVGRLQADQNQFNRVQGEIKRVSTAAGVAAYGGPTSAAAHHLSVLSGDVRDIKAEIRHEQQQQKVREKQRRKERQAAEARAHKSRQQAGHAAGTAAGQAVKGAAAKGARHRQ